MRIGLSFVGTPASQIVDRYNVSSLDFFPRLVQNSLQVAVDGATSSLIYGSWVQLIASTDFDTNWLSINICGTRNSGANSAALFDIALGSAGSESVIISSIPGGAAPGTTGEGQVGSTVLFPIFIPKGSRISVRILANISFEQSRVSIGLFRDKIGRTPKFIDTYGANTASARGVNMPTSNTYVQVTGSTTNAYQALIMMPASFGSSFNDETSKYTLAIGQSGSEVEVHSMDVKVYIDETMWIPIAGPVNMVVGDFPKGTRIACKQSVGRTYRDVIVFGVPYS